ncbi:MAG: hypothetical protein V9E89_10740 [Ilumatobacteraceae bacterium]
MKYELFDYQRDAALEVPRSSSRRGRPRLAGGPRPVELRPVGDHRRPARRSSPTAVIEALAPRLQPISAVEADPRATFLWVTDDPALNRQTRNKMLDASDLLHPARLVELDNDFLDSTLSAGRVYFLNIQKLSKNEPASLRAARNLRQYSFWDVLANTDPRRRHRPRTWCSTRRTGA